MKTVSFFQTVGCYVFEDHGGYFGKGRVCLRFTLKCLVLRKILEIKAKLY